MKKQKEKKDLRTLLIELDTINREIKQLDDPEYLQKRVEEIFGIETPEEQERKNKQREAEIRAILGQWVWQ